MLPIHSLDEAIQQADYIFEGTIIAQHTFWDMDSLNILTAHTIQISQKVSLKTNLETSKTLGNTILLTKGGHVNNDYMSFSGAPHFQIGDKGVFFTQSSKQNIHKKNQEHYVCLINSQTNFLNHHTAKHTIGEENFTLQQVYQKIESAAKSTFVYSSNSSSQIRSNKTSATISNINPINLPADGNQELSISGSGFGTFTGEAAIYMPNCNQPSGVSYLKIPENYISRWSNNIIQIKVPGFDIQTGFPGVGSGLVRIRMANGEEITSTQRITISYNHKKLGVQNIDMISHNNTGDMPFYISKRLIDDGALPAIERAMDLWYCETGIKFSIEGTVDETCYKVDNKNVISYDDGCSISQLGFTRLLVSTCSSRNDVYLRDLDIIINRDKNWSFDLVETPIGKSDFASTILHEIGHAHVLGHVLNNEDILFPIVQRTATKKELVENNKKGGEQILLESKNQNACTNFKPVSTFNDGFCCSPLNSLTVNYIRNQSAVINFEHSQSNTTVKLRYRKFGHQDWIELSTNNTNAVLSNLEACASYQVQVSEACKSDEDAQFNDRGTILFETSGCVNCDPPGELFFTGVSTNSAFLNWDVVPNRRNYEMQYRIDYTGEWKYYQSVYPFVVLYGLPECTAVQYRIRIYCDNEISNFSSIRTLKTDCDGDKFTDERNDHGFLLAPNPAKTSISINLKQTGFLHAYFILKDINGKVLQQETLAYNNYVLDLQNRSSGIYFVALFVDGKQSIQKFVKD